MMLYWITSPCARALLNLSAKAAVPEQSLCALLSMASGSHCLIFSIRL